MPCYTSARPRFGLPAVGKYRSASQKLKVRRTSWRYPHRTSFQLRPGPELRLRLDSVCQGQAVVVRHVADLQIEAVRRGGVVALERRYVDVVFG